MSITQAKKGACVCNKQLCQERKREETHSKEGINVLWNTS